MLSVTAKLIPTDVAGPSGSNAKSSKILWKEGTLSNFSPTK